MSISAYAVAVRNYLRENLEKFYDEIPASKTFNCRVMPDEHPAANCGEEFISIYGSYHKPNTLNLMQALDEEIGITIAVSRKIAVIPPDHRGELGYLREGISTISEDPLIPDDDDENLIFLQSFESTENRCRQIVKMLMGADRYLIMQEANDLLTLGGPFTEPLLWVGTDAAPEQVGADYFWSYDEPQPDSDNVFGLVQKIRFGHAVRMQPVSDLDEEE